MTTKNNINDFSKKFMFAWGAMGGISGAFAAEQKIAFMFVFKVPEAKIIAKKNRWARSEKL